MGLSDGLKAEPNTEVAVADAPAAIKTVVDIIITVVAFFMVTHAPVAFVPMAIAITRAVKVMSQASQWVVTIAVVIIGSVAVKIPVVVAQVFAVFFHAFFPLLVVFFRLVVVVGNPVAVAMSVWVVIT